MTVYISVYEGDRHQARRRRHHLRSGRSDTPRDRRYPGVKQDGVYYNTHKRN